MSAEKQIIKAAKQGDAKTIAALLAEEPALIEARDRDGSSPLHCAAWKGHAEVVGLLLEAGADIDGHNANAHWGTTALMAASHGNNRAVVELLLGRGAQLNLRSELNQLTALGHSRVHNAKGIAKLLIEHGATE